MELPEFSKVEVIDNLAQPVSNGPTPPSSKPPHPAGAPGAPVPQPSTGPGAGGGGGGPPVPTPSQPMIKPKVQQPDGDQVMTEWGNSEISTAMKLKMPMGHG